MTIPHEKAVRLLKQAFAAANHFSKDPSTKVGALFASPASLRIIKRGYNGMPRGANEHIPERLTRPLKYSYFEHAERNGIYNLARPQLQGCTFLSTAFPTFNCARAVISVGAEELVVPPPEQWGETETLIAELLTETKVCLRFVIDNCLYIRQAGKYVLDSGCTERHSRKVCNNLAYAKDVVDIWAKDPFATATLALSCGDYTELAQGYSGMPRGADDSKIERYHTEERAYWVETSVCNAIYNLVEPTLRGSAAIVTFLPCAECARGIAQVGCSTVITVAPDFSQSRWTRWAEHFERSTQMLRECNIDVVLIDEAELISVPTTMPQLGTAIGHAKGCSCEKN